MEARSIKGSSFKKVDIVVQLFIVSVIFDTCHNMSWVSSVAPVSPISNVINFNLCFPGYGVGSFLGGLFRHIVPLLKRGSIALGKEVLRSSADVVDDITENNLSLKDAVKKRGNEAVKNLKRKAVAKMSGAGVQKSIGDNDESGSSKKRKLTTKAQSNKGASRDKTSAEVKAKKNNKNKKKASAASKSTSEYNFI